MNKLILHKIDNTKLIIKIEKLELINDFYHNDLFISVFDIKQFEDIKTLMTDLIDKNKSCKIYYNNLLYTIINNFNINLYNTIKEDEINNDNTFFSYNITANNGYNVQKYRVDKIKILLNE